MDNIPFDQTQHKLLLSPEFGNHCCVLSVFATGPKLNFMIFRGVSSGVERSKRTCTCGFMSHGGLGTKTKHQIQFRLRSGSWALRRQTYKPTNKFKRSVVRSAQNNWLTLPPICVTSGEGDPHRSQTSSSEAMCDMGCCVVKVGHTCGVDMPRKTAGKPNPQKSCAMYYVLSRELIRCTLFLQ